MKSLYSKRNRRAGHVSGKDLPGGNWSFSGLFGRRRLAVLLLFILAVAGLFAGIGFYGADIAPLHMKEVVFYGNKHLTVEELRAMSGINAGESLLMLPAGKVSGRLLKSPWIKSLSIRKGYPDRLLVKIHEAEPFAILQVNSQTFLIDEHGSMLEKIDGSVPFLPVITVNPAKSRENFHEALSLASIIKERGIAAEKSRVEIIADKGPEDMSMVVDALLIKVGVGDYRQKLDRLSDIEKEIQRRAIPVDYVDLRFANKVVVKPINEVVR